MILILGGTKDSRLIIEKLLTQKKEIVVTTTTSYGASLLPDHPLLIKKIGKKTASDLTHVIKKYSVDLIIDATHPYAENISLNIIELSKRLKVKLFRYERPREINPHAMYFDTYKEIIKCLNEQKGNILLTIGSNDLDYWASAIAINRLIIRVLPMVSVLKKCKTLGFTPNQIIAMQGPFSKACNQAIMKDYAIESLVTKDTGTIGGFNNKVNSAFENNIKVYVKKRPELPYLNKFNNLCTLISTIQNIKVDN
jgi:precorrin-6A/cobalt-precorrin-6A reductase